MVGLPGTEFTCMVVKSEAAVQEPPLVVKVNVANPVKSPGGVQLAFKVVALGKNVPPAPPSVHVPPVADPLTKPPNSTDVCPWQIAGKAFPASACGKPFTVTAVIA